MSLEDGIIAEALRLGFAAAGIAAAGPCVSLSCFDPWRESGRAAHLDYLSRHGAERADPRRLAPGAQSIVVCAAPYPLNPRPEEGGFSTYARGRDYHTVLREKLTQMAAFIRRESPLSVARVCVDSAPLLEREWAIRAGIGWQGKQGQIVNEAFGCCFVLGELLVDARLTPSAHPAADRCGNCRQCLNACPTGAVAGDRQVDARRCLSYLSIEHKGDIPSDLQAAMAGTLFGCDRCTAVCPFNAPDGDAIMPELRLRPMPGPEEVLAMSPAQFRQRFRGSAVFRTGLTRLQRNAALAASAYSEGCAKPGSG